MKMFFGAVLALGLATPALAVSAVDVSNLIIIGSPAGGVTAGTRYAGGIMQTWTVGTSGKLTRVDLFGTAYTNGVPDNREQAVFDVFSAGTFGTLGAGYSDDLSTATFLGTVSMPLDSRPNSSYVTELKSVDLTSLNITVQNGQRMAFRMRATCPCDTESYWVNWNLFQGSNTPAGFVQPTTNGYTGGNFFASGGGSTYYRNETTDLNFRTWVDASAAVAVPEPASWAMLITGLGLAGTAVRRRRIRGQIVRVTT